MPLSCSIIIATAHFGLSSCKKKIRMSKIASSRVSRRLLLSSVSSAIPLLATASLSAWADYVEDPTKDPVRRWVFKSSPLLAISHVGFRPGVQKERWWFAPPAETHLRAWAFSTRTTTRRSHRTILCAGCRFRRYLVILDRHRSQTLVTCPAGVIMCTSLAAAMENGRQRSLLPPTFGDGFYTLLSATTNRNAVALQCQVCTLHVI